MKIKLAGKIAGAPIGALVFPYHFTEEERAQISGPPREQEFEAPGGVTEGWTVLQLGDPPIAWSDPFYHDGTPRQWRLEGSRLVQIPAPQPPGPVPMGLRRDGTRLVDAAGNTVRLSGAGILTMLNRRDWIPTTDIFRAANAGCNVVRCFTALARNVSPFRPDLYTSPWVEKQNWRNSLRMALEACRYRNIYLQLALFDEPDRNTKPGIGLPQSEDAFNGRDCQSDSALRWLVEELLGWIPAELRPFLLVESCNEPGSWWGNILAREATVRAKVRELGFSLTVSNPGLARDASSPRGDLNLWHAYPEQSMGEWIEDAGRLGRTHPAGLDTDGVSPGALNWDALLDQARELNLIVNFPGGLEGPEDDERLRRIGGRP